MEINQEQRLTYKRQFIDFLDDEVSYLNAKQLVGAPTQTLCFRASESVLHNSEMQSAGSACP